MTNIVKTLWRRWEVRVFVLVVSIGSAPAGFLSLALNAITKA